jgi:hypothetical protein
MSFAGAVCPEFEFEERLPRESAVIIITLVKALHGRPKSAY